ncbi:hypothetical protein RHMOL_Rhmol10G0199300 [Rhododendron molle]|uniref:Uncharacterized protein n=1 Tax=Rhododendron molle TaxID=49168 RepID=A0ACC0M432_RHOML|nr:hypothetical protein RHMOL_Rhmol10G0199300 [Rhododendron molle]
MKEKEPSYKDAVLAVGTTVSHADIIPESLEKEVFTLVEDSDGIPSISITEEEKDRIRKPWSTSIIIRVIGRTFGHMYLMSKLESLWKPSEKMECLELGNHFLLVRFHSPIPPVTWQKCSMRDHGLPIEFYDKAILCKIGAEIGKLLKIDFRTEKNEKVRFARLCVQVDLSIALTSRVRVGNYIHKISYEGIPSICFKCGLSGHKIQNCSPAPPIQKPDIASEEAKFGDWMLVTNKNRYRKKVSNPIKEVLKPEGHNTLGQWQRRNTGNPVSEGTKVTIPNGSSSSSQTQTNPNPKGLTSAILCPVAIDPVSAVVSQPLLSTIADTAPKALASAMLPPANSPPNTPPNTEPPPDQDL